MSEIKYRIGKHGRDIQAICHVIGQLSAIHQGQGATVKDIAFCFAVSKPTMQKILNFMEGAGMIVVTEHHYRSNAIMRRYKLWTKYSDAYDLGMFAEPFAVINAAFSGGISAFARAMTYNPLPITWERVTEIMNARGFVARDGEWRDTRETKRKPSQMELPFRLEA